MKWIIGALIALLAVVLVVSWFTPSPMVERTEPGKTSPASLSETMKPLNELVVKAKELERQTQETNDRIEKLDASLRKEQAAIGAIRELEESYDDGKIDTAEYVRRRKELSLN